MARRRNGNGTPLDTLVRDSVQAALVARLRVAAEQQGDLLGGEILKDEDFRQEFVELARRVARETLERLGDPAPGKRRGR
jgi:hypothetical protein